MVSADDVIGSTVAITLATQRAVQIRQILKAVDCGCLENYHALSELLPAVSHSAASHLMQGKV